MSHHVEYVHRIIVISIVNINFRTLSGMKFRRAACARAHLLAGTTSAFTLRANPGAQVGDAV